MTTRCFGRGGLLQLLESRRPLWPKRPVVIDFHYVNCSRIPIFKSYDAVMSVYNISIIVNSDTVFPYIAGPACCLWVHGEKEGFAHVSAQCNLARH